VVKTIGCLNHVLKGAWAFFPGFGRFRLGTDTHSTDKAGELRSRCADARRGVLRWKHSSRPVNLGRVPLGTAWMTWWRPAAALDVQCRRSIDHPPTPRTVVDPFRGLEGMRSILLKKSIVFAEEMTARCR